MEDKFGAYNKEVLKRFTNPKNFGEVKDADGVGQVGNMKCALPDEKIFLNEVFEEIYKSNKGDKVLTHKGVKNKIIGKFSRKYKGRVIVLKNSLGNISLTSEHLVFAMKLPKHNKYFRTKNKKKLVPSWHHAEDLEKRDIILYPIYKEIEDKGYVKFDIPKLKWDFKSKEIPKRIPLNKDFLRLCGYFLAEGHISEGKSKNYITLAFNRKEEDYINDVKKIVRSLFNLDAVLRTNLRNTTVVYIYSAGLARFFKKLFNTGAKNKSIPEVFMKLPINKQEALIEGLWKGDGYINLHRKGARAGYATISYQLAQQIKTLLLRQKIVPSIYIDKERIVRGVNHKKAYRIHIGQKESLKKLCKILNVKYFSNLSYEAVTSWFDDDFLYTPITNVEKKDYKGLVYNLKVDKFYSFVSEAFCLHNCGDIMKVSFKLDKKKKIKDIKFQTFGCVSAIASSDALCDLAKGLTIEESRKITNKDILKKLKGLPNIKLHCSVLGAEALKKAIENYEGKA